MTVRFGEKIMVSCEAVVVSRQVYENAYAPEQQLEGAVTIGEARTLPEIMAICRQHPLRCGQMIVILEDKENCGHIRVFKPSLWQQICQLFRWR